MPKKPNVAAELAGSLLAMQNELSAQVQAIRFEYERAAKDLEGKFREEFVGLNLQIAALNTMVAAAVQQAAAVTQQNALLMARVTDLESAERGEVIPAVFVPNTAARSAAMNTPPTSPGSPQSS